MALHSEVSDLTLTLTATHPLSPPLLLPSNNVSAQEGDDVVLSFPLAPQSGLPTHISWTRGDVELVGERYSSTTERGAVTLTVRNAAVGDAGRYSLSARNDAGQAHSDLLLEVRTRPGDVPEFLRRLNDLAVKVGTRTRFLVEIRSPTQVKVSWEQEGKPVIENERFHLLHEGNFFCVDVAPVTLEDAGLWICRAHNSNGSATCFCHLNVLVPKAYKAPHFIEELVAILTEQGTVSLECKVVGVPTPTLRWFKDNQEIKAGDVFALSANPHDTTSLGTYTCEATNCMGRAYSTSRVHVLSKEGSVQPIESLVPKGPPPVFSKELRNEKVKIGGKLTLSCKVSVPPWPKSITWFNKAGLVEGGGRYHVVEDGLGEYSVEVDPVEAVDEGEWKCVATSDHGVKGLSTCSVNVSYPKNYKKPKFLESLKAILTEEGLVSFECKVVGYPTPQLRWFKDGQELKPGDVYQLTGTNSLGSYCCIAKNCMGETSSTAELTVEDIQSQLNEEERLQLFSKNQPPRFLQGLKSLESKILDPLRFTVQVSVSPQPSVAWYRDDEEVQESERYKKEQETKGFCHLVIKRLELMDQAEWKCVATNDYGQSVTSCFLKLAVPRHYKKPRFLENLRAVLSEEGAVNLECKVIGVPQPTLKWYKDGRELKPGDIHRIISGQDGTCCLGTYTCEATNCMGTVSSSASLLGFEDRAQVKPQPEPLRPLPPPAAHLVRHPSLSTIQEERTSQLHDTVASDERAEVSFSFDGKEVSVSLYETPDLTEEEALQVVEMYAEELSEHISEHNIVELPPMRFVKETSQSGHLLMEAVVIDVSPEYYASAEDRTEADLDEFSITEDNGFMSPQVLTPEEMPFDKLTADYLERTNQAIAAGQKVVPVKPPRKRGADTSESSYHSIKEAKLSPEEESSEFADALSSIKDKSQKESYTSAKSGSGLIEEKEVGSKGLERVPLETETDIPSKESIDKVSERKKSRKKSRSRSRSAEIQSEENIGTDATSEKRGPKRSLKKRKSTDSEKEDDSLREFERQKGLRAEKEQVKEFERLQKKEKAKTSKSSESEREDDSLQEFESRKSMLIAARDSENKISSKTKVGQKKHTSDSSGREDDSLIEYERKKMVGEGFSEKASLKSEKHERQKAPLSKSISTDSSEKDEAFAIRSEQSDSANSRKRRKKSIKKSGSSEKKPDTKEQGVEIPPHSEAESCDRDSLKNKKVVSTSDLDRMRSTSDLESIGDKSRAQEEEERSVDFDTAEDSAYDKSEMSVLESLTHSIKEIKKGLAAVEEKVISESTDEPRSAETSLSVIESLVQPINEIQRGLVKVEKLAEDTEAGQYSPSSILETLKEPIQELGRTLAVIEQTQSTEDSDESFLKRTSQTLLETVSHPLQELQKELTFIQQQALIETGEETYSDMLHSFKPSLLVVQGGVEQTEGDFTSKVEDLTDATVVPQGTYAQQAEETPITLDEIRDQQTLKIQSHDLFVPLTVHDLEESLAETAVSVSTTEAFDLQSELEVYSEKLKQCMTVLHKNAELTSDDEVKDILISLSNLVTPLEQFKCVVEKCLKLVSENDKSNDPQIRSSNMVLKATLESPVHALGKCLHLLETVANSDSSKEIRGLGIKILYKLSFPLEELKTTMKLVENLSEHTSIELLVTPVENLISAASVINLEASKSGFAENIPEEGGFIVRELDDTAGALLKSLSSVTKRLSSQSCLSTLSNLKKPLAELQRSLNKIEKNIRAKENYNSITTSEIYNLAQDLCKPLQAIRTELSIAQHEIELDQYSHLSLLTDSAQDTTLESASSIIHQSVEQVHKSVLTCTEFVLSKSPSEHLYVRYLLFALNELILPLNQLNASLLKGGELISKEFSQAPEPNVGILAVTTSTSELLSILSELLYHSKSSTELPESSMVQVLCTMVEPLALVERGLCKITEHVHEEDKNILNINMLKTLAEPFKCLQKSLINICGKLDSEFVSQELFSELRQPIQELQRSILIIQDQVSFEYGDEPASIESNIVTLQSLVNPLNTLRTTFLELDNMIVDKTQSISFSKENRNIHSIISVNHKLQLKLSSIMAEENYLNKHSLDSLDMFPIFQDLTSLLRDFENSLRRVDLVCQNESKPDVVIHNKLCEAVLSFKNETTNFQNKIILGSNKAIKDAKHPIHLLKRGTETFFTKLSEITTELLNCPLDEASMVSGSLRFYQNLLQEFNNFVDFLTEMEKINENVGIDSTDISLLSSSDTIKDVNTIMEEVTQTRFSLESNSIPSSKPIQEKVRKNLQTFCELLKSAEESILENTIAKANSLNINKEDKRKYLINTFSSMNDQLQKIENYLEGNQEIMESINYLKNTINVIHEHLKFTEEISEVYILQNLSASLKEFKDNISKSIDTISVKTEEVSSVSSCLERFEKSASDLELGLMKLEHALLNSTGDFSSLKNIDIDVIAHPIKELVNYINSIEEQSIGFDSSKTLAEQSSLSMLKTLAHPIREIQEGVIQIQEQLILESSGKSPSGKSCAGILYEIAKPIRELRSGVALIQEQIIMEPDVEPISEETRASSLQTFAAPVEELRRVLATITEQQPYLLEADVQSMSENISILKTIAQPVNELQNKLASIEINQLMEGRVDEFSVKETLLTLAEPVQTLQENIALVENQLVLETTGEDLSRQTSISLLKQIAKPLVEISKGIAIISQQQFVEEGNLEDVTSISDFSTLANITDVSLADAVIRVGETVVLEQGVSFKDDLPVPRLATTKIEEQLRLGVTEEQHIFNEAETHAEDRRVNTVNYEKLNPESSATILQEICSPLIQVQETLSQADTLSVNETKTLHLAELKDDSQKALQVEFPEVILPLESLPVEELPNESAVVKESSLKIAAQVELQEALSNVKTLGNDNLQPTDVETDTSSPFVIQGELQQSLADVESLETEEETLESISIHDTSFKIEPLVEDIQQALSNVESLSSPENIICEAKIQTDTREAVENKTLQIFDKEANIESVDRSYEQANICEITPNFAAEVEMQQIVSNVDDLNSTIQADDLASLKEGSLQFALQVEGQQLLSDVKSLNSESNLEKQSQVVGLEERWSHAAIQSEVQELFCCIEKIQTIKDELQARVITVPSLNETFKQEVQQVLQIAENIVSLKEEIQAKHEEESNLKIALPDVKVLLLACENVEHIKDEKDVQPQEHPEIENEIKKHVETIVSLVRNVHATTEALPARILRENFSNEEKANVEPSVSYGQALDDLKIDSQVNIPGGHTVSVPEPNICVQNDLLPSGEGILEVKLLPANKALSQGSIEINVDEFVIAAENMSSSFASLMAKVTDDSTIKNAVQQEIQQILCTVDAIQTTKDVLSASRKQEESFKTASMSEIQQVLMACQNLETVKDTVEAIMSKDFKIYTPIESELQHILSNATTLQNVKQALTANIAKSEPLEELTLSPNVKSNYEDKASIQLSLDKSAASSVEKSILGISLRENEKDLLSKGYEPHVKSTQELDQSTRLENIKQDNEINFEKVSRNTSDRLLKDENIHVSKEIGESVLKNLTDEEKYSNLLNKETENINMVGSKRIVVPETDKEMSTDIKPLVDETSSNEDRIPSGTKKLDEINETKQEKSSDKADVKQEGEFKMTAKEDEFGVEKQKIEIKKARKNKDSKENVETKVELKVADETGGKEKDDSEIKKNKEDDIIEEKVTIETKLKVTKDSEEMKEKEESEMTILKKGKENQEKVEANVGQNIAEETVMRQKGEGEMKKNKEEGLIEEKQEMNTEPKVTEDMEIHKGTEGNGIKKNKDNREKIKVENKVTEELKEKSNSEIKKVKDGKIIIDKEEIIAVSEVNEEIEVKTGKCESEVKRLEKDKETHRKAETNFEQKVTEEAVTKGKDESETINDKEDKVIKVKQEVEAEIVVTEDTGVIEKKLESEVKKNKDSKEKKVTKVKPILVEKTATIEEDDDATNKVQNNKDIKEKEGIQIKSKITEDTEKKKVEEGSGIKTAKTDENSKDESEMKIETQIAEQLVTKKKDEFDIKKDKEDKILKEKQEVEAELKFTEDTEVEESKVEKNKDCKEKNETKVQPKVPEKPETIYEDDGVNTKVQKNKDIKEKEGIKVESKINEETEAKQLKEESEIKKDEKNEDSKDNSESKVEPKVAEQTITKKKDRIDNKNVEEDEVLKEKHEVEAKLKVTEETEVNESKIEKNKDSKENEETKVKPKVVEKPETIENDDGVNKKVEKNKDVKEKEGIKAESKINEETEAKQLKQESEIKKDEKNEGSKDNSESKVEPKVAEQTITKRNDRIDTKNVEEDEVQKEKHEVEPKLKVSEETEVKESKIEKNKDSKENKETKVKPKVAEKPETIEKDDGVNKKVEKNKDVKEKEGIKAESKINEETEAKQLKQESEIKKDEKNEGSKDNSESKVEPKVAEQTITKRNDRIDTKNVEEDEVQKEKHEVEPKLKVSEETEVKESKIEKNKDSKENKETKVKPKVAEKPETIEKDDGVNKKVEKNKDVKEKEGIKTESHIIEDTERKTVEEESGIKKGEKNKDSKDKAESKVEPKVAEQTITRKKDGIDIKKDKEDKILEEKQEVEAKLKVTEETEVKESKVEKHKDSKEKNETKLKPKVAEKPEKIEKDDGVNKKVENNKDVKEKEGIKVESKITEKTEAKQLKEESETKKGEKNEDRKDNLESKFEPKEAEQTKTKKEDRIDTKNVEEDKVLKEKHEVEAKLNVTEETEVKESKIEKNKDSKENKETKVKPKVAEQPETIEKDDGVNKKVGKNKDVKEKEGIKTESNLTEGIEKKKNEEESGVKKDEKNEDSKDKSGLNLESQIAEQTVTKKKDKVDIEKDNEHKILKDKKEVEAELKVIEETEVQESKIEKNKDTKEKKETKVQTKEAEKPATLEEDDGVNKKVQKNKYIKEKEGIKAESKINEITEEMNVKSECGIKKANTDRNIKGESEMNIEPQAAGQIGTQNKGELDIKEDKEDKIFKEKQEVEAKLKVIEDTELKKGKKESEFEKSKDNKEKKEAKVQTKVGEKSVTVKEDGGTVKKVQKNKDFKEKEGIKAESKITEDIEEKKVKEESGIKKDEKNEDSKEKLESKDELKVAEQKITKNRDEVDIKKDKVVSGKEETNAELTNSEGTGVKTGEDKIEIKQVKKDVKEKGKCETKLEPKEGETPVTKIKDGSEIKKDEDEKCIKEGREFEVKLKANEDTEVKKEEQGSEVKKNKDSQKIKENKAQPKVTEKSAIQEKDESVIKKDKQIKENVEIKAELKSTENGEIKKTEKGSEFTTEKSHEDSKGKVGNKVEPKGAEEKVTKGKDGDKIVRDKGDKVIKENKEIYDEIKVTEGSEVKKEKREMKKIKMDNDSQKNVETKVQQKVNEETITKEKEESGVKKVKMQKSIKEEEEMKSQLKITEETVSKGEDDAVIKKDKDSKEKGNIMGELKDIEEPQVRKKKDEGEIKIAKDNKDSTEKEESKDDSKQSKETEKSKELVKTKKVIKGKDTKDKKPITVEPKVSKDKDRTKVEEEGEVKVEHVKKSKISLEEPQLKVEPKPIIETEIKLGKGEDEIIKKKDDIDNKVTAESKAESKTINNSEIKRSNKPLEKIDFEEEIKDITKIGNSKSSQVSRKSEKVRTKSGEIRDKVISTDEGTKLTKTDFDITTTKLEILEKEDKSNILCGDESSTSDYGSESYSETHKIKKSLSYDTRKWIFDSKSKEEGTEDMKLKTSTKLIQEKTYEFPSPKPHEKSSYSRRQSSSKPVFCGRLVDRTAAQGSRLKVTCSLTGSPEPTVQWYKDGHLVDTDHDHRIRTRLSNGLASLEISEARLGDSGKYTCVARNTQGEVSTTSTIKIFSYLESAPEAPVFTQSIRDQYKSSSDELIIECRVKGHPQPTVSWFKDNESLRPSQRYQQSVLTDGTCRLVIHGPEAADSGLYKCVVENAVWSEQNSSYVMFEGRDKYIAASRSLTDTRLPRFTNILSDTVVREGGTVALQVAVKGTPRAEVTWYRGSEPLPKRSSRFRYLEDAGVYSLVMTSATATEAGTYTCRASNAHGFRDTSVNVEIVGSGSGAGSARGKPAMFVNRPDTSMSIAVGEDVSFSFRVNGDPKPRVTWMKSMKDITNNIRTLKETVNDYVRLTLKHATVMDSGTYFIMAKNIYGADHAFVTVRVKQRARSLTPTRNTIWSGPDTSTMLRDIHESTRALVKDVPGPVSSEPIVSDCGKNWLSLSWGKPEHRGAAPVLAYRVEAWLLGTEGGAQWTELGVTPINSFDVFFLKPGSEYKFRITARNRYGWGESVTSTEPISVGSVANFPPDIVRDLPGPLKALQGDNVTLECEINGDPLPTIQWLKDGQDVGTVVGLKDRVFVSDDKRTHRLIVKQLTEDDSGRYVCEAVNKLGRASTYARLLVVSDPRLLDADRKLKESLLENQESAPQFTMRLRDRRIQASFPVRLSCQVIGNPKPTITWSHQGQPISSDDRYQIVPEADHFQTLEISRTLLEDSGQYTVTAQNCLGAVSCHCELVVDKGIRAYVSPEFISELSPAVTVKDGAELRLFAQVEAYPTVSISWQRDGVRLRPSRRLVMTLDPEGRVELALAHVTSRDAGLYCCTATNAVGRAETQCQVFVTGGSSVAAGVPTITATPNIPYSKEPRFVTKPRSSEAVEGDTVVITCEVVGDPQPEVMWLRDWLKPGYYRDAPQFRQVAGGFQYSLEIPQVKLDFTGTYCVIARNPHGEAKAIISLQIYAKGQGKESSMVSGHVKHGKVETLPEIKRELKDLRCCDGDSVTLECLVTATPPPSVRWEKDGRILPLGEDIEAELDGEVARLTIKKVYPEDEGQYSCVAYNDLGRAITSACLVVDVPEEKETLLSQQLTRPPGLLSARSTPRSTPRTTPSPARSVSPTPARYREFASPSFSRPKRIKMSSPKFYTVPHNRIAEEGETVRFQCSVAGHPTPWASWDKDGHIVTPSSRLSVTERDDLRTLELREVTVEDAGLYRVTLENEMGSVEATARLDVIGRQGSRTRSVRAWSAMRASPTFGRRLVGSAARVGGTFTLTCDVHASPSPVTSWYRNGEMLVKSSRVVPSWDGRRARLELRGLQPEDGGVYTCVAENAVGTTQCSAELRVLQQTDPSDADLQPPVFVEGLPPEQTAAEGQPFELQVRLQGSSPLEVVWVKDGVEVPDCEDFRHVDYGDGRFGLRIADLFGADGGLYNCEAFNDHGDAITSGHLIINDLSGAESGNTGEPEIMFTKTPSPVLARLRGKASFCARLQSRPLSHTSFSWTVAGRSVNNDDRFTVTTEDDCSILHISEVCSSDMGPVVCTARVCSPAVPPTTVSCHTSLSLDPIPGCPATLLRGPCDTTAMRGDRVLLKATYRGDPEPSVRWLKAGRELCSEGRVQIVSRDGVSCLTISAITADDSGKYVVSVENVLGADCHFASVAVEGPPEPPAARPSVTPGDGCVTVAWSSPPYDGGCVITGYKVEMRTADCSDWSVVADRCHSLSHVVRGLVSGQTYVFRVRAENIHGASESSAESFPFILQSSGLREEEGEGELEGEGDLESRLVSLEAGEKFLERYSVHEELGKGRYGVVHKVTDLHTGHTMAAKFVRCIKKQDREKVQEEIDIMNCLRHPKLLQLAAAFENPKDIVMVMEYISGGELFERVVADDFTLTERDCILFLRQICEGVRYMHSSHVVHLDLKPENIMCHTRTSHRIKIIDFGLAQKLESNTPVRVLFGTPEFIPPEIINYEPIGVETDMWSVGVICYVLLSGLSPFMGDNDAETFANITRADFDFDDEAFEAISQDAKDFISSLLVKRKEKRLTAEECLKHKWLTQSDTTMSSVKLCTDKLKKFIIRRKWQKTGNAIRALGRMATLSAASRRNSNASSAPPSPRPSLSMSRMSSLSEESEANKTNRVRMCSERSDSGISDCSSINTSATRPLLSKKYSICEEPETDPISCSRFNKPSVNVNKLCDSFNGKVTCNVSVPATKRTTNSLRPLTDSPAKAPSPTLQKDAKLFGKSENFQKAFAFWKQ